MQDVCRAVGVEGPDLHLAEALAAELSLAAQGLLRDEAVGAGRTRVDLVVDHVAELQDVGGAHRDGALERLARAAVVERGLAAIVELRHEVSVHVLAVLHEFLNRRYEDIFPILTSYPELENYLSPFMDAWLGGAAEQLMGQIASAKIPLSRMISPQLYWVMSDSEFTLDINNPEEPKILCVGNNPDRQNIYGAALGLYNSRIVKLINKKGMLKSSVIIDELPTIYFKGLDNLIATARSNKVAVCLGFQDFSQLVRDYGDREAKVVMNTVGNIFSGQVVGETAKTLSERFGKVLQKRQSISINRQDVSTSINTQMDALIPPSKISGLTQGMFVGSVSDNFNERIKQKIFHCEIVVDAEKMKREEKAYKPIPVITDFADANGNDCMKEMVKANYRRIKEEVKQIVADELERIAGDENLKHLLQQK